MYLDNAVNTVIVTIIGAVIGGLITWVRTSHRKHTDKDRAYEKAVKSLIHDAFVRRCVEIIESGELTMEDLENLEQLHDSYRELGMNGTGEKLYQQAKSLPVKTK